MVGERELIIQEFRRNFITSDVRHAHTKKVRRRVGGALCGGGDAGCMCTREE